MMAELERSSPLCWGCSSRRDSGGTGKTITNTSSSIVGGGSGWNYKHTQTLQTLAGGDVSTTHNLSLTPCCRCYMLCLANADRVPPVLDGARQRGKLPGTHTGGYGREHKPGPRKKGAGCMGCRGGGGRETNSVCCLFAQTPATLCLARLLGF